MVWNFDTFGHIAEALETKCDICRVFEKERPVHSDGVGLLMCTKCFESLENQLPFYPISVIIKLWVK